MSCVPEAVIKHYKESRSLVSMTRDKINSATIQGFIVDYDANWIMLQYIYDLNLDGYLMLRRSYLTSLNCPASDAFQRHLLEIDGVLEHVDFDYRLPAGGLEALLRELPGNKVVNLEDETEDGQFLIGTFIGIEDNIVSIRVFSGAGRWDDDPVQICLDDITSVSFSTNYTLAYERYFNRERKDGEQTSSSNGDNVPI